LIKETILSLNTNPLSTPVVKDLIQVFPNPVQKNFYSHGKKNLKKTLFMQP